MSKLNDILLEHGQAQQNGEDFALNEKVKALFNELIGEDEEVTPQKQTAVRTSNSVRSIRNEFKAELRAKVDEL